MVGKWNGAYGDDDDDDHLKNPFRADPVEQRGPSKPYYEDEEEWEDEEELE